MGRDHDCSTCTKRESCLAYEPGSFCTEYASGRDLSDQRPRVDAWGDLIMDDD